MRVSLHFAGVSCGLPATCFCVARMERSAIRGLFITNFFRIFQEFFPILLLSAPETAPSFSRQ